MYTFKATYNDHPSENNSIVLVSNGERLKTLRKQQNCKITKSCFHQVKSSLNWTTALSDISSPSWLLIFLVRYLWKMLDGKKRPGQLWSVYFSFVSPVWEKFHMLSPWPIFLLLQFIQFHIMPSFQKRRSVFAGLRKT